MIAPFSFWWFFFLAAVVAGLVVSRLLLKDKPTDDRLKFITAVGIVGVVVFVIYRYALFADPDYEFVFWNELPLHLCNIAVFLVPIASWKNVRFLQAFCFLNCSIGAVLGAVLAEAEFIDVPVLSSRGLGYYGTHFLIIYMCLSFVVLGVYRPKFSDVPRTIGILLLAAGLMHCVNLLIRALTSVDANYFFTFGLPCNTIIDAVYSILPVPLLYEFLFAIPFGIVITLIILPFHLTDKKVSDKKETDGKIS
ncbi:MAG: YwaF family protein [Clostridia bacterium]|nr:YwaF family protein [Clostridia bacterium]